MASGRPAKKRKRTHVGEEWSADAVLVHVDDHRAPAITTPARITRLPIRRPLAAPSTPTFIHPKCPPRECASAISKPASVGFVPAQTHDDVLPADNTGGQTASAEGGQAGQGSAQEKVKVNNTIRPSKRCNVFLAHAVAALDIILHMEGPPGSEACVMCNVQLPTGSDSAEPRLRCKDCLARPHVCKGCLMRTHQTTPFHRIWRWDSTKRFWGTISLADLGMTLHGGDHSSPCPENHRPPRPMVFVHEHGVTTMPFHFCECGGRPGSDKQRIPEPHQLIQRGFFPASWEQPRSAFTMGLMRSYHLLSLQTQCSAEDFYRYLRRTTDNVQPDSVPDRYRELNTAMREFAFLRQCKRSGEAPLGQHSGAQECGRESTPKLKLGALAVLCPCCPHPGRNMRANWGERESQYGYVDALFYSIDGNFRQSLRSKPMDKDDMPLTEGAAYFSDNQDFLEYVQRMGKPEAETSSCHKFGAMGYTGHSGKVSGIVALACRHMFMMAGGTVDLHKAEAYIYVDFAQASGLQPFLGLRLVKLWYDIACQYLINLPRRMNRWKKLCSNLRSIKSTTLPRLQGCVGSWHVNAHKPECRVKQSPEFRPGAGRHDGEGMERIWSQTNPLATRTKEMTPGHRQDVMNDHFSDLNFRRVHDLAHSLQERLKDATKFMLSTTVYLSTFQEGIPLALLQAWRKTETAWESKVVDIGQHKNLEDPFNASNAVLSEEAMANLLSAEHGAKSQQNGVGMVGAIQGMIDVERERLALIESVRTAEPDKARQANALSKKVQTLEEKADRYQADIDIYVWPTFSKAVEHAHKQAGSGTLPDNFPYRNRDDDKAHGLETPEDGSARLLEDGRLQRLLDRLLDMDVDLPSMYHSKVRENPECAEIVAVERRLREGQANDALDKLRLHLTALYSLHDLQKQGAGQNHGKRVKNLGATETTIGRAAKEEYRRIRRILRVLGMPEDDGTYKVLTDEEAKPFVVTPEQKRAGKSRKDESWVWGDVTCMVEERDEELKAYMIDKIRPHWFRRRAAWKRWEEEYHIVREEMFRTLRFFEHAQTSWTNKARMEEERQRLGAAVYARRQADGYGRLLKAAQARFPNDIERGIGMPFVTEPLRTIV